MTTMMNVAVNVAGIGLMAFWAFCNGAMLTLVDEKRAQNESPFYVEWEEEIEECCRYDKNIVGKLFMVTFYCVPAVVAAFSKRKQKK